MEVSFIDRLNSSVQCLQSLYTYFERFDSSYIVKAEEWAGKTKWMSRKDGQIEVERGNLVWELYFVRFAACATGIDIHFCIISQQFCSPL